MSRKGKAYSLKIADMLIASSGTIAKAYGTRDKLAEQFLPFGEFLAKAEKIAEENETRLRQVAQMQEYSRKVSERALALDSAMLEAVQEKYDAELWQWQGFRNG